MNVKALEKLGEKSGKWNIDMNRQGLIESYRWIDWGRYLNMNRYRLTKYKDT